MSSTKTLLNTFIYVTVSFLQKGVSFLLIPVYTRYLDAEQYGIVGLVLSVAAIISVIYSLSVDSAVTRFYFNKDADSAYHKKCFGTLNGIVFNMLVVSTIIVAIAGPVIFNSLLPNIPVFPYLILATIIAASSPIYQIYVRLLRAKQEGKNYAILSLSKFTLQVALTLMLVVVFNMNATGLLTGTALASGIFFFIAGWVMLRDYGMRWDKPSSKRIWSYTLPLVPNKFAAFSVNPIQNLLVGLFQSTAQVGLFHIGSMMGSVMNIFSQSIQQAYMPWAFEKLELKGDKGKERVVQVSILMVYLLSTIALIGSLLAKEIFYLFVYGDLKEAWVVFPFFAFFSVFSMIKNVWLMPIMFMENSTKYAPIATYVNLALNIVFGIILIPEYGFIGAAVAILAARFSSSLVMMYYSKKVMDIGLRAWSLYIQPVSFFIIALLTLTPVLQDVVVRILLLVCVMLVAVFYLRKGLMSFIQEIRRKKKVAAT